MLRMKRLIVVFSLLLLLAATGVGFFAMRPMFADDVMENIANPQKTTLTPTDEREHSGLLAFDYEWDLSTPPNDTLLMSNGSLDIFQDLQPAIWKISCRQENGQYILRATPPVLHSKNSAHQVRSRFLAEFGPNYQQRHPDGTMHPVRTLKLICELWIYRPFFQKVQQAFAMQEVRLDLIDGSADVYPPVSYLFLAKNMQHRVVSGSHDAPLPRRHCGNEREQLFSRILYTLASIDAKPFADVCTREAIKHSDKLLALQADSHAPWPDCWGDDAPMAQKTARRLIPTLQRFQELHCYGHQPLIDYINSDTFSRIFGESFESAPAPILDTPPIIFERVSEEKIEKN